MCILHFNHIAYVKSPFFNYNQYYALYYIENALKTRFVCNSTYWPRHKFTASTCRVLKIET